MTIDSRLKTLFHILLVIIFIIVSFIIGFLIGQNTKLETLVNNQAKKETPRPLDKYSIENLSNANIEPGTIKILKSMDSGSDRFDSYLIEFKFRPDLKNTKKTTGQLNVPKADLTNSLVIMIRGYVDQTIYQTGVGTKNAAKVFAENGYITISLDYLGYGGSDSESGDIFESRFQTYVTTISLIKTLQQLKTNPSLILNSNELTNIPTNQLTLFIWAHSNGGQIALTSLEVLGDPIPTVLWAPVTKPFPYSVLYYTDESEDRGKLIRNKLAEFERLYDVNNYSLDNYLDRLTAPILIQQGSYDDAVPVSWSTTFTSKMKKLDKDISYIIYNGADHNMKPKWNEAIEEDLSFFSKFVK